MERVSPGGAERERKKERERENPKKTPCLQRRAQCGARSHEPWDHDLSQNQESDAWLSHTGALRTQQSLKLTNFFAGKNKQHHFQTLLVLGNVVMPLPEENNLMFTINKKDTYLVDFFFNVYLFLRDKETAWAGEKQRERETQNLKQTPGSELSAQSLTWGLNPRTARSWPEPKTLNQLSHPGAPYKHSILKIATEGSLGVSVG